MKKLTIMLGVLLLSFALLNAGGKYDDVKPIMEKQLKLMEEFAKGMEAANDAEAVAAVLTKAADAMTKMIPDLKALQKNHPGIQQMMQTNPPEELKPLLEKIKAASMKLMGTMGKIQQYATSEVVQKAQQKLMEVQMATQKAFAGADDKKEEEKKEGEKKKE